MSHDYERLFREAGPGLWRVMYGVAGGRRDIADDAVAEAFVRAMEHGESVRDPLPWMYRTALRICRKALAEERRHEALPDSIPGLDPANGGLSELLTALGALSANQRAAVLLFYTEDLPTGEVARRMGTSPATARVHLHRGRKRLRALLEAEEVHDA